jgi:hypothetical protein
MNETAAFYSQIVGVIENRHPRGERFITGRYPYTYAYDYMRQHHTDFGVPPYASRMDCAERLRSNPDREAIVVILADAYLRENSVERDVVAS